ncbi:MAG TPA: hypothetical protein VFC03_23370, partial [Acidimicrobiales bacterium]|nr:hypothetical protein [Acidimicrobiales bacterium]
LGLGEVVPSRVGHALAYRAKGQPLGTCPAEIDLDDNRAPASCSRSAVAWVHLGFLDVGVVHM